MPRECFYFVTTCGAIILGSGHWYNYFLQPWQLCQPVLSLSFLDVYGYIRENVNIAHSKKASLFATSDILVKSNM
jgi:hypothetical protein